MQRTVLEYAVTDKFIMLFLTAEGVAESDLEAQQTVNRDQFDPELVAEFEAMDDYGIPDNITCSGVDYNITDDGELHGLPGGANTYSFRAKTMKMTWLAPHSADPDRRVKHREDGPASVEFNDFKSYHDHGTRTGFEASAWKFLWYYDGNLERPGGPFSINGDEVKVLIEKNDTLRFMTRLAFNLGWNHPSGRNLTTASINGAIQANDISLNQLHPGASVFDNEMERAFFYSAV